MRIAEGHFRNFPQMWSSQVIPVRIQTDTLACRLSTGNMQEKVDELHKRMQREADNGIIRS
jgi:hypothetical protein